MSNPLIHMTGNELLERVAYLEAAISLGLPAEELLKGSKYDPQVNPSARPLRHGPRDPFKRFNTLPKP